MKLLRATSFRRYALNTDILMALATLLFVLASVDSDSHLDMLQALVEEISDEEFLAKLLEISSMEELSQLLG